jgi:hypothetical protein
MLLWLLLRLLLEIIFFSFDLCLHLYLNLKVFDRQEQDDDEHEYVVLMKNYFLVSSNFLNDFFYFDDNHFHLDHHTTNLMDTSALFQRSLPDRLLQNNPINNLLLFLLHSMSGIHRHRIFHWFKSMVTTFLCSLWTE